MRPRRGLGLLLFLVLVVVGSTSPARAWTRTVVKGARATVEIERDATLSILLRLDIEVHAGWLQEVELAELGEGVELDRTQPPYFRSDEGEIFRPEAEASEDGLIRLSFQRREAPKQGEYRLFLKYRTKADLRVIEVAGGSRARIVWSVPAWETGLHNVLVEFRAPGGSTVPTELHETPPGVELQVADHRDRTVVEWRRIHLPRMSAWSLMLDIPIESIAVPIEATDAPEAAGFRPLTIPEQHPIAWSLLVLAVLVLLKRRSIEVRMGRDQLLFHAAWVTVFAVTGAVVAAGQWLVPSYPVCALALIALSLHRPTRLSRPAEDRSWCPVAAKDLPETGTLVGDCLDGSTGVGLAVLVGCSVSLLALGEPAAALFLMPVFLTGTQHHMIATAAKKAELLRRFAADLRLGPHAPAMSLNWELSSDRIPRLRVHLPVHRTGLISLGFVLTSHTVGFIVRRQVMLLVETRAQSDADDIARRRVSTESELRTPNGSVLRLIAWNTEAVALLAALARSAPKPMEPSRGTWLLREISEPGCKAA
ncbi:MAG: hypothetical protein WCE62_11890 [Polyangiales bacterium]